MINEILDNLYYLTDQTVRLKLAEKDLIFWYNEPENCYTIRSLSVTQVDQNLSKSELLLILSTLTNDDVVLASVEKK